MNFNFSSILRFTVFFTVFFTALVLLAISVGYSDDLRVIESGEIKYLDFQFRNLGIKSCEHYELNDKRCCVETKSFFFTTSGYICNNVNQNNFCESMNDSGSGFLDRTKSCTHMDSNGNKFYGMWIYCASSICIKEYELYEICYKYSFEQKQIHARDQNLKIFMICDAKKISMDLINGNNSLVDNKPDVFSDKKPLESGNHTLLDFVNGTKYKIRDYNLDLQIDIDAMHVIQKITFYRILGFVLLFLCIGCFSFNLWTINPMIINPLTINPLTINSLNLNRSRSIKKYPHVISRYGSINI